MKKILLCDDDKDIVGLMEIIVASIQCTLISISYIKDIIEQVKPVEPDLILMDLRIPQTGGENAIRTLKSNDLTKHIPVVLFSASMDVIKISEQCGANGYILKPFNVNEFKEKVREMLGI